MSACAVRETENRVTCLFIVESLVALILARKLLFILFADSNFGTLRCRASMYRFIYFAVIAIS